MRRRKREPEGVQIPITPMIDCVFLLLVYFITTSSMKKTEADLGFELPGEAAAAQPLAMQTSQMIEIDPEGHPIINQYRYPSYDEDGLIEVRESLKVFSETCALAGKTCEIVLSPQELTSHREVIKIMDALAAISIEEIQFQLGDR